MMTKAEMKLVLLKNEIVTTSGCTADAPAGCDADCGADAPVCGCFEFGVINPDSTNDEC